MLHTLRAPVTSCVAHPHRPEGRLDTVTSTAPAHATEFRPLGVPPNDPPAPAQSTTPAWPLWQRVLFRFFCVYFVLQVEPWNFFRAIPGVSLLFRPYDAATDTLTISSVFATT